MQLDDVITLIHDIFTSQCKYGGVTGKVKSAQKKGKI